MESKNNIIMNYAADLTTITCNIDSVCKRLNDSEVENQSIIKTIYVYLETLKAISTFLQGEIDKY